MAEAPPAAPVSLDELRAGGRRALARVLNTLEGDRVDAGTVALLDEAFAAGRGGVVGITGPPGVGKSSLISALIRRWRSDGLTVAVLAVDPSSRKSGGALLGDRYRMKLDAGDAGVFTRSLAARESLGGLAAPVFPAATLLRALYDLVIVETVGVGQSETEVRDVTDLVVFCVQPGSGDAIQFMKAGIAEIPDIVVVTKADIGAAAERALADAKAVLRQDVADFHAVSAQSGAGIDALARLIAETATVKTAGDPAGGLRTGQAEAWCRRLFREEFGRHGMALAPPAVFRAPFSTAFRRLGEVIAEWHERRS